MAIISANLQFNRGGHELLDYSSSQKNYTVALEWAKNPYSNAAVGQYIYLKENVVINDVEYTKGPYVIDAIGENAIITPLSKSIAGSPDLVEEVSDLKTELNTHINNNNVHIQENERKRWTLAAEAIEAFKDAENIGDELIDTLKEIQDYITSDLSAADKMTKDIAAAQDVANETKTSVDELTNTVNELFEEVSGEVEKKLDTSKFNEYSEVNNNVLNTKVDVTEYNTKIEEITSSINSISNNIINVYTKSEVDTELALKVNVGDIYTKSEIDSLSNVYAPKAEFEEVQKKVEDITSTGGEPNVQSDWNTTDEKLDSFIKNKPDLSIFVKQDELNNKGYLIEENLQGYATENWVNEQNYLTEHQDISHLATKDELSEIEGKIPSIDGYATEDFVTSQDYAKKSDIPSLDGYVTEEWVNGQGYITEIPTEYITEEVLNSKGYLTEHQDISNLITKEELSEVESKIPSIEGYATKEWVRESYASKDFVTNKIAEAQMSGSTEIDLSGYVTKDEYNSLLERVVKLEEILSDISNGAVILTNENINEYAVTSIKTNETNDINISGNTGEVILEINSISNKAYNN